MRTIKARFFLLALFLFCNAVQAESNEQKLNLIKTKRDKIQAYIDAGETSPELLSELEKLDSEYKEVSSRKVKSKVKKLSSTKKKALKLTSKSTKSKKITYKVDRKLSLRDQYKQVLFDLEREQEALTILEGAIDRGVASQDLKLPIKNLRQKISAISLEKTKIERKVASEGHFSTPDFKLGAMLDIYYLHAVDRGQEGEPIPYRVYDRRSNDFTMNLIEFNLEASVGKFSFYADLDFGDFADQNSAHTADPVNHNIGQAHMTYQGSEHFSITAGKMYTHVGYEVAKAMENWNYSRSYAFTLAGPFWHEGVAFNYNWDNGYSAGVYIYDGWDSSVEESSEKSYGAQFGYANDKFHFLLNLITGDEGAQNTSDKDKTVYEFNTQYSYSDKISFAFNYVKGQDKAAFDSLPEILDNEWTAYVLYANWDYSDRWSFTSRLELFQDTSNASAAANADRTFPGIGGTAAEDVKSFTLTSTYHASEHVQFRIEARHDQADESIWKDKEGSPEDQFSTVSFGMLANF